MSNIYHSVANPLFPQVWEESSSDDGVLVLFPGKEPEEWTAMGVVFKRDPKNLRLARLTWNKGTSKEEGNECIKSGFIVWPMSDMGRVLPRFIFVGLMGGQLGNKQVYCDEVILLIWKVEGLGEEGPFKYCDGTQRRNVLKCPPVVNKIHYPPPGGAFLYQKPMALYAELLLRYLPREACTVAELTGTSSLLLSHVGHVSFNLFLTHCDIFC